jgi:hypothetical protein
MALFVTISLFHNVRDLSDADDDGVNCDSAPPPLNALSRRGFRHATHLMSLAELSRVHR